MIQIYGTIGPNCRTQDIFESMLHEGMNGIRLNLSHGSLQLNSSVIRAYADACRTLHVPQCIMIDLHGPEQRVGVLEQPIVLQPGDYVKLQLEDYREDMPFLPLPAPILHALSPEDRLLIHDGSISLQVCSVPENTSAQTTGLFCRTLRGGTVKSNLSVKIEGKEIYGPVLTEEDLANLKAAKSLGITSVMQPFVRSGKDIQLVRSALHEYGIHAKIFAKIESLEGYNHLDSIIRESDVIVIARGDLGQAVSLWALPVLQKKIAAQCRACKKPFMVVTQMLESMISSPVPTRAEVSDIFNAVLDGASYLMVTGETAVGQYPDLVIHYLKKTTAEAEQYLAEQTE